MKVRATQSMAALVVLVCAAAAPAGAEDDARRDVTQQAIAHYAAALDTVERDQRLESFRTAQRLFARVAAEGPASANLYTNLGNAALQAEHLGDAVLAYRHALEIEPDHPRAMQNLVHARAQLPGWVPRPESGGLLDTFFFWHRTLSASDRALTAALAFGFAGLLFASGLRFELSALRAAALLPALVWLAVSISVAIESRESDGVDAVVTADQTVARAADSALAASALPEPLPGGAEVRVLEERSPWLRVRLANGRDVWIAESAASLVRR